MCNGYIVLFHIQYEYSPPSNHVCTWETAWVWSWPLYTYLYKYVIGSTSIWLWRWRMSWCTWVQHVMCMTTEYHNPRIMTTTNLESCTYWKMFRLTFSRTTAFCRHGTAIPHMNSLQVRGESRWPCTLSRRCTTYTNRQIRNDGTETTRYITLNFLTRRHTGRVTCVALRNRSGDRNVGERNLIVDLQCKDVCRPKGGLRIRGRKTGKEGEKRQIKGEAKT